MTLRSPAPRWLGLLAVLGAVTVLLAREALWSSPRAAPAGAPAGSDAAPALSPADRLKVVVTESKLDAKMILEGAATTWEAAPPTRVILNRTPRIYQTEPVSKLAIPALEVSALRSGDRLFFRLHWDDASQDAPQAPPRKEGEGGDPAQLYKRPTGETASFSDAAAVMVPREWTGPAFPPLQMGGPHTPARLYYWSASRGAEELLSSGRATPQRLGKTVAHQARHAEGKWSLVLELSAPPEGCPVAFAVWDGHNSDRDGLKFFSIWYALRKQ